MKINEKFTKANFPLRFTNSVVEEKMVASNDLLIPEFLFKETRKFILIEIPFY